jgi:predicted nucleic acid-binding protein
MIKILIDTMHVADILMDDAYFELAQAIKNRKIMALVSAITLTELIKIRRYKDDTQMYNDLNRLTTSNLMFIDVDRTVAISAGKLRLKYDIPTADSIIAATGVVENVKHILTDDEHFDPLINLIKPINLKTALKMAR